ncbi:MAG: acylphosphatase [Kordiimonas sp.]
MDEKQVAVRAQITGRVQGVWYRGWAEQQANELGLFGWVRNRKEGSVEALFIGPQTAVDEMLRLCEDGPDHAVVEKVGTETAQGLAPRRFEIKPTV